MRWALCIGPVLGAALLARAAGATPGGRADEAFREALAHEEAGRYADARKLFEESARLDPASGTLIHVANCEEHEGRLAAAWDTLRRARALAVRDHAADYASLAEGRATEIAARLPAITVIVPREVATLAGVVVREDGQPLAVEDWGAALPVDPGEHLVEASAPGRAPWTSRTTVLARTDRATVVVPMLAPAIAAPPVAESPHGESVRTGDEGTRGAAWSTGRVLAVGLAAGTVAATALGVGFGLASQSAANTAANYRSANPPDACVGSSSAMCKSWSDAVDAQNRDAIAARVFYVAGGVLAAGAVVAWFFGARASADGPRARTPRLPTLRSVSLVPFASPRAVGVAGRF
jgi:hypothetical protein